MPAPDGVDTVKDAIKKAIPDVFIKRRLNFITIHYLYLTTMTIVFSGAIYGIGGLDYIDSLFFASGACTQSGLNTVDFNKIYTGQQVILYMLAMLCNPIAIHTSVVFIRLYWFEKRFKDVVKDARALRRTKSKGRTFTFTKDDPETGKPELNIRGRAIQLLRSTGHRADGGPVHDTTATEKDNVADSSSNSGKESGEQIDEPEVRRPTRVDSMDALRIPQQMNAEQHIRFLENQRNPKDSTTLHIPSPREFERGGRVQSIDDSDEEISRQITKSQGPEMSSPEIHTGAQVGQHITFTEPPQAHRHREKALTFPPADHDRSATVEVSAYDADAASRSGSRPRRASTTIGMRRTNTARTIDTPYLSYQPTVARNSFFVNLTEEQREELGGIEYRALKTLALILIGYFFFFHILGIVCLTPWIYHHYGHIVTDAGQGRAWWGVFTAASAFNDLGFTLTADSMNSFNTATFPLLIMTYLIIIGNTGFPCMLRCVIWLLSKFTVRGSGLWEELQFLLDHPRRCFTLLFPRAATWWLFGILVVLNGVDLLFFVILDLHDETVSVLSGWVKFLDGLFQAASTRTAGFSVVNIANLHPAIQVSYLIMMYISVFPIAISMRRTNVYEEKSLGIYASPTEQEEDDKDPSYVSAHLRKQLSFDLWYIFLGLFIISIVEGARLENTNEYAFTIFSVLFEIVSAYGTVGLSLGYPTVNASFSSQFKVLSKLVIIAMQIRGRHRGLPYELDRAVLLPSESLHKKEEAEAQRILQRRRSSLSAVAGDLASNNFRAETGLSSSANPANSDTRERRFTNRSHTSNLSKQESHKSHVRAGLGTAMYKLAEAPEDLQEQAEKLTPYDSNKNE